MRTGRAAVVLDDMRLLVQEKGSEGSITFDQEKADSTVSAMLTFTSMLMKGMKTEMPTPNIDAVGALAAHEMNAFVATGTTTDDDFVAVATGVMNLFAWTNILAALRGKLEPRSLTYWASGLKLTPDSERLLPMVLPIAHLALGEPISGDISQAITAQLLSWKEQEAAIEMMPIGLRSSAFVLAHEIGHWACGHGAWLRKAGGILSQEQYHRAEFEADAFAVHHFRPLLGSSKFASQIWPLYALFAVTPECLEAYPDLSDAKTHPHPLKRLSRVLAKCCPENRIEQDAYVDAAVNIVDIALATVGKPLLSHSVGLGDIRDLSGHPEEHDEE